MIIVSYLKPKKKKLSWLFCSSIFPAQTVYRFLTVAKAVVTIKIFFALVSSENLISCQLYKTTHYAIRITTRIPISLFLPRRHHQMISSLLRDVAGCCSFRESTIFVVFFWEIVLR